MWSFGSGILFQYYVEFSLHTIDFGAFHWFNCHAGD